MILLTKVTRYLPHFATTNEIARIIMSRVQHHERDISCRVYAIL